MPELHDRVYAWLCKKSKGSATGKLRCNGILDKLRTDVVNDPVALRKALIHLRAEQLIEYAAGQHGEPISGFMMVVPPPREVPRWAEVWSTVVYATDLTDSERVALESLGGALEGFNASDMGLLLGGLIRLRDNQALHFGQQAFSVSAMYLMGSSKLLSTLDGRALRSFGIELDRFASRPAYVVVGGNVQNPSSVVLIENPVSFEAAVESGVACECLFVCTFGFGLSASTNDYGNQLAGAVESGLAQVLNRASGAAPSLRDILQHQRIQFWGDLDKAGMQIFCRLASKVPNITLSALYEPMIEAIQHDGSRHPYVSAVCKDGQARMTVQTARNDVQELLRLCERFAVDQEFVCADDIALLAGKSLDSALTLKAISPAVTR